MQSDKLYIDEVFLSLQGEAARTGVLQLFVRLGGCPLRCSYCDTPRALSTQSTWELHLADEVLVMPNPVLLPQLDRAIGRLLESYGLASCPEIALTGGEPLLQHDILHKWLESIDAPVMLETAGVWPDRLQALIPRLDSVSLDWKFGSLLEPNQSAHSASCLQVLASSDTPYWVKLVYSESTDFEEVHFALQEIEKISPQVRVWLQPVSSNEPESDWMGATLLELSRQCHDYDVQLFAQPQLHPFLKIV